MEQIEVAAAVILRRDGLVCICSRPADKPPAGWEFPGGKLENGESVAQALRRELVEELGCGEVTILDRIGVARVEKNGRILILHFLRCLCREPEKLVPRENQTLQFVARTDLPEAGLLRADARIAAFLAKKPLPIQ